jgi:hypothetical protein
VPEEEDRQLRIQEAVDKVKARYGANALTTGLTLAAAFRAAKDC